MSKWYEALIACFITIFCWIIFKLGQLPDGAGKFFSIFGIAILPTAYFQIRNTETIRKYKFSETIENGEKIEKSPWFWVFALILNTLMVGTLSMLLYMLLFIFVFPFIGYDIPPPF